MVPVVAMEFHADAIMLCRKVIFKVAQLWTGNFEMKRPFMALFYERLAALIENPKRSFFATAQAPMYYAQANQAPYRLRCLIWMVQALRHDNWVLLYQHAWLEKAKILYAMKQWQRAIEDCRGLLALKDLHPSLQEHIRCPTSSVAQANLMIKINFNILRSFSSSDILTIYLHAFLQSFHPFEKNCVQGLPQDFRQNNPNANKKFRWSFSAISHQLSFGLAKKEKVRGCQIWRIGRMRCRFHSIETDGMP
jgi:hypothetical protein